MSREIEKRALTLLYGTKEQVKAMENKTQYDNTNTGGLWLADNKTEDWHSDWSGVINIDGVDVRIKGYNNVAKDGREWIRLKVDNRQPKDSASPAPKLTKRKADDEEIPF